MNDELSTLIDLIADAQDTAAWQRERELDALGDVAPPETPPVIDAVTE